MNGERTPADTTRGSRWAAPVPPVLFFALFLAYLALRVDPRVMYHFPTDQFPRFRLNCSFLATCLGRPGGPVAYVSAFLSQLFVLPWAGALIVTCASALLSLAAWRYLCALRPTALGPTCLVPAVLVLALYGRYAHVLSLCVAMALATCAACAYVRRGPRTAWARAGLFLGLAAVVYYATWGALLLFAVLCAVGELLSPGRRHLAPFCLLVAGVLPLAVGGLLTDVRPRIAYGSLLWLTDAGEGVPWRSLLRLTDTGEGLLLWRLGLTLYFWLPAVALLRGLWPAGGTSGRPRPLVRSAAWAAFLLLGAGGLWVSHDVERGVYYRIDYCSRTGRWEELLEAGSKVAPWTENLLVFLEMNRALYHLGQLPHDMFRFRRGPGMLLPNSVDMVDLARGSSYSFAKFADILADLGRVNEAEHMAYEALELVPDDPHLMRLLICFSAVKYRTSAARVLLNSLADDLVMGRWAREGLGPDGSGRAVLDDPEVVRLRGLMAAKASAVGPTAEQMLVGLLERNPRNQMAFEYLMAHYLLTGQLDKLAANMARLDDFGYAGVPRHYEEALLIYEAVAGRPVDLGDRRISEETRRRFDEFSRLMARHSRDLEAVRALAPQYGDTYFLHYARAEGLAG